VVWKHEGRELVIALVAGGDAVCFDPADGRELWRTRVEATTSTPVIAGDRMIVLGHSRQAGLRSFALSAEGAKQEWMYRRVADHGSSPLVVGNRVYAQGERRLACVDVKTGEEVWQTMLDVNNPQYTSPVAADGKVFYTHDGVLCWSGDATEFQPLYQGRMNEAHLLASEATLRKLLDLDAYEQKEGAEKAAQLYEQKIHQQGPVDCASPALADGRLIVRLPKGVVCFDLRQRNTDTVSADAPAKVTTVEPR
jgi:hypothetical protein